MVEDQLGEAIYRKYISPLKRKHTDVAGLEFEFPIVNLNGGPVRFDVVHELTDYFVDEFAFTEAKRDDDGFIYCAEDPVTGDTLSYDCSYNTLEFSFGIEKNLNVLHQRFLRYYSYIEQQLAPAGHTLTGMGISPARDVNRRQPVANGRYRMLLHHLKSYKRYGDIIPFHDRPDFGLFSCASQCQFDVDEENVLEVLNTFTLLEPLKAVLFANSPYGDLLLSRDYFWNYSMHGVNPHNVGMWEGKLTSIDEIVEYIRSMSIYCMERDGKYINIPPTMLDDYFNAESVTGEYFDGAGCRAVGGTAGESGHRAIDRTVRGPWYRELDGNAGESGYRTIEVVPEIGDLTYLRSFKLDDLTFRGTVEFRSFCEQPVSDVMAPAAYTAGLLVNLHELTELLENDGILYGAEFSSGKQAFSGANISSRARVCSGNRMTSADRSVFENHLFSPTRLRALLCRRDFLDFVDRKELTDLLIKTVSLAEDGLRKRGLDEEHFLKPLYSRAEQLTNSAREMVSGLESGIPMREFVERYAQV